MFHPCFQCFPTLKPTMFHLLNINDWWNMHETSMKKRLITVEEIATFTCFTTEFKGIKIRTLHTKSSFPITLSKNICQIWFVRQKNNNSNFDRENFDCYSQNWLLSVQNTFLGRLILQFIYFLDFDRKKNLAGILKTEFYVSTGSFSAKNI